LVYFKFWFFGWEPLEGKVRNLEQLFSENSKEENECPWVIIGCGCRMTDFDIMEEIAHVETIAVGKRIRELPRLEKQYGSGRWRKMKGEAKIRLRNGRVVRAELHWYEAHGIGRKEFKRKRYLD
jgi:hypothetical protein